jgi:hypothetical protein
MDRESELNLAQDAPAAAGFLAGRGGCLHLPLPGEDGVWWAELHPAAEQQETYTVRIGWRSYPSAPPSIKFVHKIGGPLGDPHAWPVTAGYRPTQLDVCKPFTAEGFALHPDWEASTSAWAVTGNPFLGVVRELQRDLNSPSYNGRFRG